MSINYRTNDAVITICQNNKAKLISITEMNEPAKDLTGYGARDLIGRPLDMILPPRIAELMTEYVEFDPGANDVGAVLSKVRSFSIVSRSGAENAYRVRVVRESSTDNLLSFSLILQNTLGERKNEATRQIIQDNFKGHEALDPQTEIPDKNSLVKDIGVMKRYTGASGMLSCFAVLQIDNHDKLLAQYGHAVFLEIFKHVASVTKRSLRPDDVAGYVGDGRIGVLLVDITAGSQRVVLNRLRWQIASNPYVDDKKTTFGISVSMSFCDISDNASDRQTVEKCEAALDKAGSGASNMLVDAGV